MNIVRIRDSISDMEKAGVFGKELAIAFREAPLFVYQWPEKCQLTKDEEDFVRANLMQGPEIQVPVVFPYKTMIVVMKTMENGKPMESVFYFTTNTKLARSTTNPHSNPLLMIIEVEQWEDILFWARIEYSGMSKLGVFMQFWKDGKSVGLDEQDSTDDRLKKLAAQSKGVMTRFAFDVASSRSTIVRVKPKEDPTKSVVWRKAREHFLILSRKQAIQCRDQKRAPTDEEITRAAHWRRAHLRRLSAARFRHKQGRLVQVKQAWVGPKEWEGTDGKIYEVVET